MYEVSRNSLGRAVILKNDADLLQEFLDRGMHPTFDDELGRNALHWAVYYGFVSSIKVLVEYGVDLSLKTFDGETAADIVRNLRARRLERLAGVDADASPEAVTYYEESIKEYDEILAMLETT